MEAIAIGLEAIAVSLERISFWSAIFAQVFLDRLSQTLGPGCRSVALLQVEDTREHKRGVRFIILCAMPVATNPLQTMWNIVQPSTLSKSEEHSEATATGPHPLKTCFILFFLLPALHLPDFLSDKEAALVTSSDALVSNSKHCYY